MVTQETTLREATVGPTRPEPTIEVTARDGGGRTTAWTVGETTAHTPLLLARPGLPLPPGHGVLLGPGEAVPTEAAGPVVVLEGGFSVSPAGDRPYPTGVWSRVTIDRARRLEGQLSLRRGRPPTSDIQIADEEYGDDETTDVTGIPEVAPVVSDEGAVAVFAEAGSAARDPAVLMPLLLEAREKTGPGRLLYAPGIGLPHQLALLVYAGVDLFDTLAVERASLDGLYLTSEGVFPAATTRFPLSGLDGLGIPAVMDPQALLAHNLAVHDRELAIVRAHLQNGTLRELVETRVRAHPASTAALRHLDLHGLDVLARKIPLTRDGHVHANTMESLSRPDVVRFRERIRNDYQPPEGADVLVLFPCSARKPYGLSRSHKVFARVIGDVQKAARIHEVIVTSPLGVVPRELENTWPAAHYDVPVTGAWDPMERAMIREQVAALLAKGGYTHVVSHLGASTHALIADFLPEGTPHTGIPHPTRYEAKDLLRAALREATRQGNAPAWPRRRLADAKALATWQFGPAAADALFAEADDTGGRPPVIRVFSGGQRGKQLAQVVPQRGLLSLTIHGAKALFAGGQAKVVEIDDFVPRGTVFAVGVKQADPGIVPGDEVVLVHDGEVRGVGPAVAPGPEMTVLKRGPCVEVRHHV
ncbi:MAG: DUF5591 domain-containing protein [Euryarchaeota archaeon]|nr:DUF5591 domain-containing protein [Euryarchaeota archaeon]